MTLNISSDEELLKAYELASAISHRVIVERQVKGSNFRVLVVGGSVAAVSERFPAAVEGDGIHTVKELIDIENSNPLGDGHEMPLTKIKVDSHALLALKGRASVLITYPRKGKGYR